MQNKVLLTIDFLGAIINRYFQITGRMYYVYGVSELAIHSKQYLYQIGKLASFQILTTFSRSVVLWL